MWHKLLVQNVHGNIGRMMQNVFVMWGCQPAPTVNVRFSLLGHYVIIYQTSWAWCGSALAYRRLVKNHPGFIDGRI